MAEQKENHAWKAFDTSSEAGRLLRQIYGGKPPPVNVPLPRRSKNAGPPKDGWRPVSNRIDQVDPRKSTRSIDKERAVQIPRKARADMSFSRIDFVSRRKRGDAIREELDDAKMRMEHYRPPHSRPMDREKDRLAEICAFKGGKILPAEMTAIPLEITPSEQVARIKERERLEKVRRRRAGLPEAEAPRPAAPKSHSQMLEETILQEIDERRTHLADMERLGMGAGDVRRVAGEIAVRVRELKKVNPELAATIGAEELRNPKLYNPLVPDQH